MHNRKQAIFATLLVLVTVGYGIFQARSLIAGPQLVVRHPTPGATVEGDLYEVRGTATNVTRVRLNGRPINTDPSGKFSEQLAVPEGYTVILVEAENRFGRMVSRRIEIVGRPSAVTPSAPQATTTSESDE